MSRSIDLDIPTSYVHATELSMRVAAKTKREGVYWGWECQNTDRVLPLLLNFRPKLFPDENIEYRYRRYVS